MKVYLLKNDSEFYKIGFTKDSVVHRMKQLNTGTHYDLDIVFEYESEFASKIESNLHRYFTHRQINREWFDLSEKDIEDLKKLCEMYHRNFKLLVETENPYFKYKKNVA